MIFTYVEKYYSDIIIAKIHLTGFSNLGLYESLKEMLENCKPVLDERDSELGKFEWTFGDSSFPFFEDDKIIFGKLGKNRESERKTTYHGDSRKFVKEKSKDPKTESISRFAISTKTHIIIFEEKKSKISWQQFVRVFSQAFWVYYNDLSSLKIDPMIESGQVFQWIKQYDKITSINFHLSPSNPDSEEEFEAIDQLLRESKTKDASLLLKNKETGLNTDSLLFKQGIYLSGAGYGNYSLTGEKGNEESKLDSKDKIMRQQISTSDDEESIRQAILNLLRGLSSKRKR